jgi:tryptophan halogenase
MSSGPVSRIVIAGGGSAGWMVAAALGRFLDSRYQVTLVESEAIGTVGVGEATIPQIHLFNRSLGIDERQFVAATEATYKLGIEFDGWTRRGHRYMHAFGPVGRGLGLVPFHHLWRKARASGLGEDYGAYSLNEAAARAGRLGRAAGGGRAGALPDLVYAFHFDASLYAAFLRRFAEANGVTRVEGKIEAVQRDGESGNIAALQLDGERRIEGDLFIDCTGFRGLLIGEALGSRYLDWSNYLPCNRALAVPCARSEAFRPYTQSLARDAGWQWRIPLQHRTGNGHVFCDAFMHEDEAAAVLLANLDGEPLDQPRPLRFTAGRRAEFWSGNCVALGLAAGFMEPLESTSLHLVQSGIARLLTYFPRSRVEPADRAEFNRLTAFEWERIRDFIVLHYKANGRVGEPFWDACRDMAVPDSLQEKLEPWRASGRLHREGEELFTEEGWAQVLIGQNVLPADWHPLADQVEGEELAGYLKSLRDAYLRRAAAMPTHAEAVRLMVAS